MNQPIPQHQWMKEGWTRDVCIWHVTSDWTGYWLANKHRWLIVPFNNGWKKSDQFHILVSGIPVLECLLKLKIQFKANTIDVNHRLQIQCCICNRTFTNALQEIETVEQIHF